MQIYLIRHGSTAGNLERRYVGSTDEELTAEAAEDLRIARGRYPVPDRVFVSPMKRCVQTARILFPERIPEAAEDLRECSFGEFEYRNYEELCGNAEYQRWIDSGGTLPFPGGESREAFAKRCCAAFERCCREATAEGCKAAAFVVHGGTIMAILDRYARPHRDYFEWQTGNAQGYQGRLSGLKGDDGASGRDSLPGDMQDSGADLPLWIEGVTALPEDTDPIGIEEQFVMRQSKKLRCGYTTGSCAAAAAKAAAEMLLRQQVCRSADLEIPQGIRLHLPVQGQSFGADYAQCAVRKYGGDDPDATDGLLIWARVEYSGGDLQAEELCGPRKRLIEGVPSEEAPFGDEEDTPQVLVDGGAGIGRVTKPGLEQPVGSAAINRVPREMIAREVSSACRSHGYDGQIRVTISAPDSLEIAKKTFNSHIGIEGGISILGTSGIVVPMSEEALLASIRLEMRQKRASGERYLLITPGNYGADFIRGGALAGKLDAEHAMKCSNYVGETVDMAVELGFEGILFVAHIGKFIKVSGGIMNTHSAHADCRAELLAAQAMRAMQEMSGSAQGAGQLALVSRLLAANTTEEAVGLLRDFGILEETMRETAQRIRMHLQRRCRGRIQTEAILFSNQYGYLGETAGAAELLEKIAAETAMKPPGKIEHSYHKVFTHESPVQNR